MIYITVMRLNSAKHGRGVNIYLHRPQTTIDQDNPWQVMDEPGPTEDSVEQREVPRGVNRVEAYLDLFFDDQEYSLDTMVWALDIVARRIEEGTPNPAKIECEKDGRIIVRVAFSVNLGLHDLMSKRRVFNDLRGAFRRWETRHAGEIIARAGALREAG